MSGRIFYGEPASTSPENALAGCGKTSRFEVDRDSLLWWDIGAEAAMRGADERSAGLFSYVSCEARVPADHPLRGIRAIVDEALEVLSVEFEALYAKVGRPSIAPEKLLRALQLDYNLLFRWF